MSPSSPVGRLLPLITRTTWRTFPQKLGSSCATSMSSDTVPRIQCVMANGVKSESSSYRQKDCPPSRSMPRRVTMRRRNNVSLLAVFLLTTLFLSNSYAQGGTPSQSPAAPVASSQTSAPANPDASDSGVFVFRKQVEEVVLHATVVDDKQRIITTLDKSDFNVFEDGHPQTIT